MKSQVLFYAFPYKTHKITGLFIYLYIYINNEKFCFCLCVWSLRLFQPKAKIKIKKKEATTTRNHKQNYEKNKIDNQNITNSQKKENFHSYY